MAFAVFIHRADSPYEDSPATQYQFPKQYLTRVEPTVGDWIVYLEPSKVRDTRGYYAIARVQRVIEDPVVAGMYVALIEPGSYLQFAHPVPYRGGDGLPVERGVLNDEGNISGRAQAAVRPISGADLDRILMLGLREDQPTLPRLGAPPETETPFGIGETAQAPFVFETERERIAQLTTRIVRDRVFRRIVLDAYDERCGITGLKLINGGGRAEVAAAHIRPVERNGPDIVNNGIALSGTAHWMFDRGLIAIENDLTIVISRHVNDRDGAESLINPTRRLIAPRLVRDRPHPAFLAWHRENRFKQ
jgi:putative restriction endonuclease